VILSRSAPFADLAPADLDALESADLRLYQGAGSPPAALTDLLERLGDRQ
jgi:hypothetical protein